MGAGTTKKLAAIASLVILGATPSFIDWQQAPDKHGQILGFYALAIGLFWYGLLS